MTTITSSQSGAYHRQLEGPVFLDAWLTTRRYVDLLRIAGALCRAR